MLDQSLVKVIFQQNRFFVVLAYECINSINLLPLDLTIELAKSTFTNPSFLVCLLHEVGIAHLINQFLVRLDNIWINVVLTMLRKVNSNTAKASK